MMNTDTKHLGLLLYKYVYINDEVNSRSFKWRSQIESSLQQILCSQRRVNVNRYQMDRCYALITVKFSELCVYKMPNGLALFLNNSAETFGSAQLRRLTRRIFSAAWSFSDIIHYTTVTHKMFRKLSAGGNTESYFHKCCFSAIGAFAHKVLRHGSRPNPPPWGVTPPICKQIVTLLTGLCQIATNRWFRSPCKSHYL